MPHKTPDPPRRICFITGSRAEFGLTQSTLRAIQAHRKLSLQIIATGMHLDPRHGQSIKEIRRDGWKINTIAPWKSEELADATGHAITSLAQSIRRLKSDIILIVGDRAEAFAGAVAGHLAGRAVAHVHGGDRAQGQVDDSLRHAITKLAHIHFPATSQSADRIRKLGEDAWRIHTVGSPGIDGIKKRAATAKQLAEQLPNLTPRRYALIILHPIDADDRLESTRARAVLTAAQSIPFQRIVIVYPNNDPGSAGIIAQWKLAAKDDHIILRKDIPRPIFLGLLRDAAVLVGNSSSGIIEAASFGTPVVDIGPRQLGRQRCEDVTNVPYGQSTIASALRQIWNRGDPRRGKCPNPYGGGATASAIARVLASVKVDRLLIRKLISY